MEHNFMRRQAASHSVGAGVSRRNPRAGMLSVNAYSQHAKPCNSWLGVDFGGRYVGNDYESPSSGSTPETLAIGNEKKAMENLNDRLACYLETVKELEMANSKLEIKIQEAIEKRGPEEEGDYSRYNTIISELIAQIIEMIKDNAHHTIALDNARLASDDFRDKIEYELSMCQTWEADVAGLREILDDTNVTCMHLESEIESLEEELMTLKKNHDMDVAEMRGQIHYGVHVDVDAPKGQDLAQIMDEMRAKYELIAQKNQDEVEAWHESQITEVQGHVDEQSSVLKEATNKVTEITRNYQALEIELQSMLSLKENLKATLHDIEMRNDMEMEKYNTTILKLQDELTDIHNNIKENTLKYELLLNIKIKLEAEIAEYRRLLESSGDFTLEDAVDSKVETKVVTITQRLVDGKLVQESKDVQSA